MDLQISTMQVELLHSPGNAAAKVALQGNEKLVAEAGAMIAMSDEVEVVTSTRSKGDGGFLKGMKRMLAGESLFMNTFTAPPQGGEVYLATNLPGDMCLYELDGSRDLIVQGGSFVACGEHVDLDTSWQGFSSSLLSGESLVWLRMSGKGATILHAFGSIYEREVQEDYIVDTGHIVAFESKLSFEVERVGKSWFSSMMGGEGYVCRFKGDGRLFCQTHHPRKFGKTLGPRLKPRD